MFVETEANRTEHGKQQSSEFVIHRPARTTMHDWRYSLAQEISTLVIVS